MANLRGQIVKAACGCVLGNMRNRNEDNFYFNGYYLPEGNDALSDVLSAEFPLPEGAFFAVFDGMGGESYGDVASFLSAQTFAEQVHKIRNLPGDLVDICMKANEKLCKVAKTRRVQTVGSTAAMLCIKNGLLHIANVGDSKVFLMRQGKISQISRDHTDQNILRLFDKPKRKPRLTQYLGIPRTEMIIEPFFLSIPYQDGDRVLVCSDGLTDSLAEDDIGKILITAPSATDGVYHIVERALAMGGKDNITAIFSLVS